MISSHHIQRWLPVLIIATSTCLSIGYSLGPLFEGPDERQHYNYARYLADVGELPDMFFQRDSTLGTEFFQPPLYYSLAAPIKSLINDTDFDVIAVRGNYYVPKLARLFDTDPLSPSDNNNKNFLLHSRREAFPYTESPTALAVHLIRLTSVLMSILTLIACWQIFKLAWPDQPHRQWIALGVVAFWPLRAYISGVINNDNLITLMSTVALLLILRQYDRGPSMWQATLLGVTLGVAALSKESALLLAAPVGTLWLLDFKRQQKWIPVTMFAIIIIAGWWYIRNWIYYGEFTSFHIQPMYVETGSEGIGSGPIGFEHLPGRLLLIAQHFWGNVGHDGVVPLNPELNAITAALTVLAVSGAIWRGIRWARDNRDQPESRRVWVIIAISGTYMGATIAGLVYHLLTNAYAAQPRFLIPGVAIIASAFAFGWDGLIPPQLKQRVGLSLVTLWAGIAGLALLTCFFPAYRPLKVPDQIEHRLSIRYENRAVLLGASDDVIYTRPGDTFSIQIYWGAIQPAPNDNLIMFVHVDEPFLAYVATYPGNGHMPASEWRPGEQWAEGYTFHIPEDAQPGTYPLEVNVAEDDPIRFLDAFKPNSYALVNPIIATVIIEAESSP